ncbi:hypothetical protein BCR42DRAFT_349809 [Absidia repens]|uniref:Uncharacterized protein n=1 Tax=Absidia repens TaxID=90262 RepID=A0A1X2IML9_9FUNG|nr:hypothetical protein BCR42DRAFT_349809 [Absidia repens]
MKSTWFLLFCTLYAILLGVAGKAKNIQLQPTYTTPKNIAFGAFVPGSSHVTWVLRFLDELASRGHNVTFITVDENIKYAKAYPRLKTMNTGPAKFNSNEVMTEMGAHPKILDLLPAFFKLMVPTWDQSYQAVINTVDMTGVDLLICDHFSDGCMDASFTKELPLIVTSTMAMYPDAGAAYINNNMATMTELTTVKQSIYTRFYNKFILPLTVFPTIKPHLDTLAQIKRDNGLVDSFYHTSPDEKSKHALKIVSTTFGLEVPRAVGPLVELVGPVLSADYSPLDASFDAYLSTRHRVVYVAFGQHAKPDMNDVKRVLTSLIQQREKGHIDGIIWSSRSASPATFPRSITSSLSGKSYDIASLFDTNGNNKKGDLTDDIYISKWSPQMALLLHPSVTVFVSHGGANSVVESLYSGTRVIFYPFFGDQPGNAKQYSSIGLSEYFDYQTDEVEIDRRVEKVILDKEGSYQQTVKRYQALVQIHSKASPSRAADLVEEAAFSSEGRFLPQREDVGQSLSFLKRHNLDIYGIVLLVVGITLTLLSKGVLKLARFCYKGYRVQQKTKTL